MSSQKLFGNVFITGATGFLGSELVHQLLEFSETNRIVCLVRDLVPVSRFFREHLDKKVIVVPGDIRDQNLLDRVLNEYEINTVFHLAAQPLVDQANLRPTETLDVNIRGTWSLLEAVRNNSTHVKSTIIASSDKAYGNLNGSRYDENFPLSGIHPYDVSKSCADLISTAFARTYDMNIAITRCGNFFGPGDLNMSRIFPSTILAVKAGTPPVLRSDGTHIRDYIYVADGAAAYRLLARSMLSMNLKGEAFNFSYGLRLTVLNVVEKILSLMGSSLEPIILNRSVHEIPEQSLDSTKAQQKLHWKPQFGFDEGIKKTIVWYLKNLD